MRPPRHHPWVGGAAQLPPRRELTEDELEDAEGRPRSRAYLRACGCSVHGPCVAGRCAKAPPSEAGALLASVCTCCGYAIVRGRCGRCRTPAAEVQP